MKLPKWLVATLIAVSVLAPAIIIGWWWITWPDRTLREFIELVDQGKLDQADDLMAFEPGWRITPQAMCHAFRQSALHRPARAVADIVCARQRFTYDDDWIFWVMTDTGFRHVPLESLAVERGKIRCCW